MRALQKQGAHVGVFDIPPPELARPGDVRIAPARIGLCRTDVYVARGLRPSLETLTLGHEVAGTILEVGAEAHNLRPGQRVAVMPLIGCGVCAHCHGPTPHRCPDAEMLGVDRDGAFAQELVVPARAVHPIPDHLTWEQAAYLEPIAASMAPLQADIPRTARVLIYGDDRIGQLTHQALRAHGHEDVTICALGAALEPASFEYAVETRATPETLSALTQALTPGGTLILKSRPASPVALNIRAVLARELTLRATRYAPFAHAIEALATGCLHVDDLLGPTVGLEDFEVAFAQAGTAGARKIFFDPNA